MNNLTETMRKWRHELHQIPELGFEVLNTATYITQKLQTMGMDVVTGIGKTGLVATLVRGEGSKASVAIRADMDALAIHESPDNVPYASKNPGHMHACGHDGHMAIVLGAAQLLANSKEFSGTIRFIFQPDEENGAGAKSMLKDGLIERFPFNEIYGIHNMPGIAIGKLSLRAGGIMASEDHFDIRILGRGTHAARPHLGIDPMVIAAEIIMRLQTIVSREIDPSEPAVISCTEIKGDGIRNAIPNFIYIGGNVRAYSNNIQNLIKKKIEAVVASVCTSYGATYKYDYRVVCSPTVNWKKQTALAAKAARETVGEHNVDCNCDPLMISEDFGAFLEEVPGCFSFIGNGIASDGPGGIPLHDSRYDFNDDALMIGARFLERTAILSLQEQNK